MSVRTVQDLGAAVRAARRDKRWTQADLAARLGVYQNWVSRLERGHPRLETQLVLDALDAVGVELTVGRRHEAVVNETTQVFDELFRQLRTAQSTPTPETQTSDD